VRPNRPANRAFTMLEVMNFIALACVLGALGMYGLARYVRPLRAHVNLIPLNPTPGFPTVGSSPARVRAFRDRLVDPSGQGPWLDAIARHVCHRWRSRQARLRQRISACLPAAAIAAKIGPALEGP